MRDSPLRDPISSAQDRQKAMPGDAAQSEGGESRERNLASQLTHARLLPLIAGLGILLLAVFNAPPVAFGASGAAMVLVSYALALRGRILTRRVTKRTSRLEGFPARLTACLDAVAEPLIILDNRALVVFANRAARFSLPNCKENNPISFAIRSPLILDAVDRTLKGGDMVTVEHHERVPLERYYRGHRRADNTRRSDQQENRAFSLPAAAARKCHHSHA